MVHYTDYTPHYIYKLINKIQLLAGFVFVNIALGATDTELSTETTESAKQMSSGADEKKVDSDTNTKAEILLNEELFIMNDFEVTAEQDRGFLGLAREIIRQGPQCSHLQLPLCSR